jgi:hypothetical protein
MNCFGESACLALALAKTMLEEALRRIAPAAKMFVAHVMSSAPSRLADAT